MDEYIDLIFVYFDVQILELSDLNFIFLKRKNKQRNIQIIFKI